MSADAVFERNNLHPQKRPLSGRPEALHPYCQEVFRKGSAIRPQSRFSARDENRPRLVSGPCSIGAEGMNFLRLISAHPPQCNERAYRRINGGARLGPAKPPVSGRDFEILIVERNLASALWAYSSSGFHSKNELVLKVMVLRSSDT
jgi:hypothetical protein